MTIVLGDFLERVSAIPDASVALVFADFPFNCQDGRKDYRTFVLDCAEQMRRITMDGGAVCVLNNPHNHFKTMQGWEGLTLVNEVALIRRHAFRPARHLGFQHNSLLVMSKGKLRTWNGVQKNHEDGPTDVIQYQNGFRGFGEWHPQAIGYNLTRSFVELLTNKGDLVVDPFTGSGTTAIACQETGRRFWGTEVNPRFYDMAIRRTVKDPLLPFTGMCPDCGGALEVGDDATDTTTYQCFACDNAIGVRGDSVV